MTPTAPTPQKPVKNLFTITTICATDLLQPPNNSTKSSPCSENLLRTSSESPTQCGWSRLLAITRNSAKNRPKINKILTKHQNGLRRKEIARLTTLPDYMEAPTATANLGTDFGRPRPTTELRPDPTIHENDPTRPDNAQNNQNDQNDTNQRQPTTLKLHPTFQRPPSDS